MKSMNYLKSKFYTLFLHIYNTHIMETLITFNTPPQWTNAERQVIIDECKKEQ